MEAPGQASDDGPKRRNGRIVARWALLLLVIIPFLPEIAVVTTALSAKAMGCLVDQVMPCAVGAWSPGRAIDQAIRLSAVLIDFPSGKRDDFYLFIGGWLIACYVVLSLGWSRMASRFLLGSVLAFIFAVLSTSGPFFAIAFVGASQSCRGTKCRLFGDEIYSAGAALAMSAPPFAFEAAALVGLIFAIFVGVVIFAGSVSRWR